MRSQTNQEETFLRMTEEPVSKLIPRLAIPTIISMLVTSIYNMADTYFVSQIGTSASAAVGINFSLQAMIQAIGFTLGMGSGNYVSRALGKKLRKKAEIIAAMGFFTAIILGLLLAVVGLSRLDSLVRLLGATSTVAPYARSYGRYILIAAPYMCASFVLNNLLRSQGKAFKSMIGIATGGVLNMVLDPILIFKFNLGISGAAIATIFSQLVSFLILSYMIFSDKELCKPKLGNVVIEFWPYREIIHGGLPTLCRQGLASVASITLNVAAAAFGDAAIAAMSIVNRIMMFIYSSLIGFGQGFQPVCGYSYGAKKYQRVLDAFWFCVKVAVVLLTVLGLIFFIAAPYVLAIFRKGDLEVISLGARALRLQCLTLPLQAVIIMSNMLTQSIGFGIRASIISAGRQGLFYIPSLLILPKAFGVLGLQISQTVSDACTFVMAVIIMYFVLCKLKELAKIAS